MISINNLNVNSNDLQYTLEFNIKENEAVGIYSRDSKLVEKVLLLISGINYSKDIFYDGHLVFDNPKYFKNRIYMDFSRSYLATLNLKTIENMIKETFNRRFDREKFTQINKDLDIRGEAEITTYYKFTPAGQTLANLALLSSLNYDIAIVNNPLSEIKKPKQKEYAIKKLHENHKILLLGLHTLGLDLKDLNHLIILDDFGKTRIFEANQELFVVDNHLDTNEYDNLKVFISDDNERLIILNSLTRNDLKYFKQHKISYVPININEIENYL